MKVQGLVGVLLAIVIGVSLLPTVTQSVDEADVATNTEDFTAVEDNTTEETFTLSETTIDDEVNYVEVEGSEVDSGEYTVSGSEVTLNDTTSTTDDEVTINYDYEKELGTAVQSLIDLLPILFTVILVSGAVAFVRSK